MEWSEWSPCENQIRTRDEVIRVEQSGTGDSCPELQSESEGE